VINVADLVSFRIIDIGSLHVLARNQRMFGMQVALAIVPLSFVGATRRIFSSEARRDQRFRKKEVAISIR